MWKLEKTSWIPLTSFPGRVWRGKCSAYASVLHVAEAHKYNNADNWWSVFRPIAHLPCPTKATLAVRCCPVYFELRTKKGEGENSCLIIYQSRRTARLLLTCSQALCLTCTAHDLFFLFLPLQMVLLRLSPMLSTYHTVWCLLWHLRTPFYYMTHSRLFPLAWWPTFTITLWVTLHGKAAPSCVSFEVSCLFVIWGN